MADGPKIVIATFGSLGDLNPYVGLAHALKRRGLRPVLATSAFYRAWIESEGLEFFPVRPDFEELTERLGAGFGEIADRVARDESFLLREMIFPYLRLAYEDVATASEGAAAVVAHNVAYGAKLAAERLGLPLVESLLSPLFFMSAYDPPLGPGSPFAPTPRSGALRAYNRLLRRAVASLLAYRERPVARLRRELGLPRRRGAALLAGDPYASFTIALASPLLIPPQPDHPRDTIIAGHTFHDRFLDASERLPAALEDFLAAGAPPVVVSLGSLVMRGKDAFYRAAAGAARAQGLRAVLLVAEEEGERLRASLPPDAFVAGHLRHSLLFPRAAAILHHGGAGSSGQALRAGRPQLVVPVFGDQGDNAARLERLGVARRLPFARWSSARLEAELAALLAEGRYARAARAAAEQIGAEDGAAVAVERIAALVGWAAERVGANHEAADSCRDDGYLA